jgi:hypothetical protein
MRQVALYTRVSTDRQTNENQERELRASAVAIANMLPSLTLTPNLGYSAFRHLDAENAPRNRRRGDSVSAGSSSRGSAARRPVSGGSRTSLCQHREFLPGKRLPRPETGAAFSATLADSGRHCPASPAAKPRKVKDYSDTPESGFARDCDSNRPPTDYGLKVIGSTPPSDDCLENGQQDHSLIDMHRLRKRRHGGPVPSMIAANLRGGINASDCQKALSTPRSAVAANDRIPPMQYCRSRSAPWLRGGE